VLYRVNVIANGHGEPDMPLGVSTIEASDRQTAENQAIETHWDDRLTAGGCFCKVETVEVSRYLVSPSWQHYFDDTPSTIRFVFDNKTLQMAYMEVKVADDTWVSASKEDCADVVESLHTANEGVFTTPADYDAEATDDLPAWVTAH
jgi:hypothetical protein